MPQYNVVRLGPKFVRERPRAKETGYIAAVQPARSGNARRQCSDGEPMRLDNLIATKRWPWCERGGRFSALRAGAFAIAVAPALWIALALAAGWIAAEPLKQAPHLSGTWTLYFLLGTLAVPPLKLGRASCRVRV